MRPLVEPPPSLRCKCGGELRLRLIETAGTFRKQREIYVCTNCSGERTFLADQNPYVPYYEIEGTDGSNKMDIEIKVDGTEMTAEKLTSAS